MGCRVGLIVELKPIALLAASYLVDVIYVWNREQTQTHRKRDAILVGSLLDMDSADRTSSIKSRIQHDRRSSNHLDDVYLVVCMNLNDLTCRNTKHCTLNFISLKCWLKPATYKPLYIRPSFGWGVIASVMYVRSYTFTLIRCDWRAFTLLVDSKLVRNLKIIFLPWMAFEHALKPEDSEL